MGGTYRRCPGRRYDALLTLPAFTSAIALAGTALPIPVPAARIGAHHDDRRTRPLAPRSAVHVIRPNYDAITRAVRWTVLVLAVVLAHDRGAAGGRHGPRAGRPGGDTGPDRSRPGAGRSWPLRGGDRQRHGDGHLRRPVRQRALGRRLRHARRRAATATRTRPRPTATRAPSAPAASATPAASCRASAPRGWPTAWRCATGCRSPTGTPAGTGATPPSGARSPRASATSPTSTRPSARSAGTSAATSPTSRTSTAAAPSSSPR